MRRFDAIIFDFDGTLAKVPLDFDLMRTRLAALAEAFLCERPTVNGQPILEWVDKLARQIAEAEGEAVGKEFHCRARLTLNATEIDAARRGALFGFTRPLLDTLRERGVATGVITRNISPAVLAVFPDLPRHVGAFIPRDGAVKVKPDPTHLLQALHILDVVPERTLMVGDHAMDIQVGVRAGAVSAGVTTGSMDEGALREAGAEFVARDAGALIDQLFREKFL